MYRALQDHDNNTAENYTRFMFRPFQLDLEAGRLSRGLKEVALQPKAFAVLGYLAARHGCLVSKEELVDRVWRGVHVSDDVVKVAIAALRKVLDDPHKTPRFIETVHRRGYRFVANMETVSAAGPARRLELPKTRYVRSGGNSIAFQVVGDGPLDLLFLPGWISQLEYMWTEPLFARFLLRLASFSRLILVDKRGTGLSDRDCGADSQTLERRRLDISAVMDAAGSRRAVLCGASDGGATCASFAAAYPRRTDALILLGTFAKGMRDSTYPWGTTRDELDRHIEVLQNEWGGPLGLERFAPSRAGDVRFRDWWAGYLRNSASPESAIAMAKVSAGIDIRKLLPAVRVPTLVLQHTGDKVVLPDEGRYLASRIRGAHLIELPGADHIPFTAGQDAILNELQQFLSLGLGMREGTRAA